MPSAAGSVGDRDEVVGGERAERGERDRHPDDPAGHDVGEVVDAEVDPQRADDRDRDSRGDLRPEPRTPGNDEHERHADREECDRADRDRRRGVALPARELLHAERSRSQREKLESLQERPDDAEGDQPDHQMAPATEPRGREHDEQTERREPDAGSDVVRLACERVEPPGAERDDGIGDPCVEPVDRARIDAEPQTAADGYGDEQDQPGPTAGTDLLRQRRGCARRPTTSVRGDPRAGRRPYYLVMLIHGSPREDPRTITRRTACRSLDPSRSSGEEMADIQVFMSVSLDGVMQAPARPDEDTRGGFSRGGWAARYADPVMWEGMGRAGSLLLGRRTYEDFYAVWPKRTDNPFTPVLNASQKYVVSTTLTEPLPWENSTLLRGDAVATVADLKEKLDQDLMILGSGELVRSLMGSDLIDAYTLLIHPLVLGTGQRLFAGGGPPADLELAGSTTTGTGVVIATYRTAGPELKPEFPAG